MRPNQISELDPPIYRGVVEDLGWNPKKIEQLSPTEAKYRSRLSIKNRENYEKLLQVTWRSGDYNI